MQSALRTTIQCCCRKRLRSDLDPDYVDPVADRIIPRASKWQQHRNCKEGGRDQDPGPTSFKCFGKSHDLSYL